MYVPVFSQVSHESCGQPTNPALILAELLLKCAVLYNATIPLLLALDESAWFKYSLTEKQVYVKLASFSFTSPRLEFWMACGPRRARWGRTKGKNTKKNRGNNGRIFIACNSIQTITHSIRNPTEKQWIIL